MARSWSLFLALVVAMTIQQAFQLFLEFADVFEVAVDTGEADVGHGVEAFEVVHDQLANFAGGAFALGGIDQKTLGSLDDSFEFARGNGTLFAGAEQAAENFLPVESL